MSQVTEGVAQYGPLPAKRPKPKCSGSQQVWHDKDPSLSKGRRKGGHVSQQLWRNKHLFLLKGQKRDPVSQQVWHNKDPSLLKV
jgi:hypothetical protein